MPRALSSSLEPRLGGGGAGAASAKQGRIAEIQRARMLAAMAQMASEHGAGEVTVAHVVERAGVSRRTFYEAFDGVESCLLAAFDYALKCLSERVLAAHRSERRWRERTRAALAECLCFAAEEPQLANLLVVQSLSAGARVMRRRSQVLDDLIAAVDAGRSEAKSGAGVTRLTAEGVVGAVMGVVHARIADGSTEALPDLLNPLMSMIVLPYLGSAAARRELERSLPRAPQVQERVVSTSLRSDPFKDAGMRLTYRTMRVLRVIASEPGSSNRHIGDVAGVADQGQMSKLLGRLERIGLIANAGAGHTKGEPNAWTLTQLGRQVESSISTYTEEQGSDPLALEEGI